MQRERPQRKPYEHGLPNPNYDSPVAQLSRQIEQQRAERASRGIRKLHTDKSYRPAPKHISATIEKECVGCGDTFLPPTDPRETHCTWCDALEGPNA